MPQQYKETFVHGGVEYGIQDDNTAVIIGIKGSHTRLHIAETIDDHPVVAVSFRAFWRYNIVESISLPMTLTEIGTEAFANCDRLQKVIFRAKNIVLKRAAFSNCGKLEEVTGRAIQFTNGSTFENCSRLCSLDAILEGRIYSKTFYNCKRLHELHFAEGASISEDVFKGCMSLENLHFGSDVTVHPDSLNVIAKRNIYCNKDCPLADLSYLGTKIVFNK